MTIGREWKENCYQRLRGYLWLRYERHCEIQWGQHGKEDPEAYNRYVRGVMALEKRQKEGSC